MRINSCPLSLNLGLNNQQIFTILVGVVYMGAMGTFVARRAFESQAAQNLCRSMAVQILADAKENPPEVGTYEATLLETDSWGQPLTSTLIIRELSNSATVRSTGRDQIVSNDDHSYGHTDVHVRKSILKGITAGAHSAGKGLTMWGDRRARSSQRRLFLGESQGRGNQSIGQVQKEKGIAK